MSENEAVSNGDKELWGTPDGWGKRLCKPVSLIKKLINSSEGEWNIDGEGRRRIFYAESYIRERLQDVLELPVANREGSFIWNGERYGIKKYWTDELERPLNIEENILSIVFHGQSGITAITHGGTVKKNAFFSESQVMQPLDSIPISQEERHLVFEGQDYWIIRVSPEEYPQIFDFKYEELVIAKAPSGKIRLYRLAAAVERVFGYNPNDRR